MEYRIINGKNISDEIKNEVKEKVYKLKSAGISPCLAVICAGNDVASAIYVRNKKQACAYCGISSLVFEYPDTVTEEELLIKLSELNRDKSVSGILVQIPLPPHINPERITDAITPEKDVDGFHPVNAGCLSIGRAGLYPCTPSGIIQLLKRSGVELEGKNAVVIGRSNIVGKPMALMLLRENATVTLCHSKTEGLKEICRRSDIIIAALGRPRFINEDYVREGAAVIDVGIHRNESGKLCGDVDFERVKTHCAYISPVPGGVGPMTIAMLMVNTLQAALVQNNLPADRI